MTSCRNFVTLALRELMHRISFWSISECLNEPFLIVVFESLNYPQCEKMDLKIIQSLLEMEMAMQKMLEN